MSWLPVEFGQMRRNRPINPRPRKRTLLIQCEGQKTEPNYLDGLCTAYGVRHRIEVTIKTGKGQNAVVTVNLAIAEGSRKRLGQPLYDEVWCVLDVEHAAHEATLNAAISLARKNNIRLFLSNPSFEVWLIAHFERTKRAFADGGAAEAYLSSTHWRQRFNCEYEKGNPKIFDRLADKLNDAVDNAQWVLETFYENASCRETNASTEVYQLVQELSRP